MKISGVDIEIDGEKYTVPPLSLGQLRNGALKLLQEHDQLIVDNKIYEAIALRGELIILAMKRNYPDLSDSVQSKIMDYLDVVNSTRIWSTILGISGFKPGEAPAATGTEPTGT